MNIKSIISKDRGKFDNNYLIVIFIFIYFLALFYTSPLLSYCGGVIFLALVNLRNKSSRYLLVLLILISASEMYASRVIGATFSDDFYYTYLPVINSLKSGQAIFQDYYAGGLEFGIVILFKLFVMLGLSNQEMLFMMVFGCSFFSYIWLEIFVVEEVETQNKSLFVSCFLLFFVFFSPTLLMRQAIATVLLLFSISNIKSKKYLYGFLFLALAFVFHTTSLIVILVCYIYLYGNKAQRNILLLSIFICILSFNFLKNYVLGLNLLGAASYKLEYYNGDVISGSGGLSYLKFFLVSYIGYFFFSKDRKNKYLVLLNYSSITYLLLMTISEAAGRLMYPEVYVLIGVSIYFSYTKTPNLLRVMIILYSFYKILIFGPLYDDITNGFRLWQAFPWYGWL